MNYTGNYSNMENGFYWSFEALVLMCHSGKLFWNHLMINIHGFLVSRKHSSWTVNKNIFMLFINLLILFLTCSTFLMSWPCVHKTTKIRHTSVNMVAQTFLLYLFIHWYKWHTDVRFNMEGQRLHWDHSAFISHGVLKMAGNATTNWGYGTALATSSVL